MSLARLVVMLAAAVRVRGLVAGGCGLVNGRRAAAAARRGRPEHLLLAVQLWRNGATLHRHQCCLPAGIGACSHDELANRAARHAARLAGRVECQAQRPWWPMWTATIVPAAAGLDESAAYGTGLRVLHVENGLLEILNSRCDAYAAIQKWQSNRRRQMSYAAAAACCWPSGARGLLLWLLLLLELVVVVLAVLL